MALSAQHKKFCDFLLLDKGSCAKTAYLQAYPKSTEKAADGNSSRLMARDDVKAYLAEARAERSERTKIDADFLLTHLAEELTADLADIYDENGAIRPVRDWPKIFRQGLVTGVDVLQNKAPDGTAMGEVVKIKHADRNAIKKMIGDHIGVQAFKENKHVTGEVAHTHTVQFVGVSDPKD